MRPRATSGWTDQPAFRTRACSSDDEPELRSCIHGLPIADEDAVLGAAALNRIREGKEKTYSLDEVITELGLDASDL